MMSLRLLTVLLALLVGRAAAQNTAETINIAAAENFYGDVARQLVGTNATVTSILSNPDQDPHLFEVSPSVARLLYGATIVVYNGAGYDPWMTQLLSATGPQTARSSSLPISCTVKRETIRIFGTIRPRCRP